MIRLVLAVFLLALVSAPADAKLFQGAGGAPASCPSPNAANSIISSANLNCFLHTSGPHVTTGNYLQYQIGGGLGFSSSQGGSPGVTFNGTTQAENCPSGSDIYAHVDNPAFGSDLWFRLLDSGGGSLNGEQQTSGCNAPTASFVNNTTTASYFSMNDMCSAAAASSALEVKLMPSGVPFYSGMTSTPTGQALPSCPTAANGLTITLDAGVKLYNGSCNNNVALFCIQNTGVTLIGAGATVGYTDSVNEIIDVLPNSTGPTIEGSVGSYLVVDCQGLFGQQFAGLAPNGIESGRSVGTMTVSHVKVQNCGGGGGQNHPIYMSWGGSGTPTGDPNYIENYSDVIVTDATGDTVAVKFDTTAGTSQGTATNLSVYTTIEGHASNNGDDNEIFGYQCGGNHLLQKSYGEMYGQPGANDQWAFSKQYTGQGTSGAAGCQSNAPTVNSIRFDKDVFVFDGHANPSSGFLGQLFVVCAAAAAGNDCGASGHILSCVTNSEVVENDDAGSQVLVLGAGVSSDAGCTGSGATTNTFYLSRAAACGVASNWPSDGHGCAWPYVPQLLADNSEGHDQLVAQAHAAGRCGEGTESNPIQTCAPADQRIASAAPRNEKGHSMWWRAPAADAGMMMARR